MLRLGDRLLRKLNHTSWDPKSREVFPAAFEDKYADLSVFVERLKHPREVLVFFAGIEPLRKANFGSGAPRTPEELWDKGIGIGVITYDAVVEIGGKFKLYDKRYHIDTKGHVDVINGKRFKLELSMAAVAMTQYEIFGTRH